MSEISKKENTMSHAAGSYKRRIFFIKKEFQIRFILKFCLLLLAGIAISTGLLFLFSQDTLTSSFEQSRLVIKSTGQAILPSVIYTNLITLGLVTLATIVVTLFVSHKIAGPMFRFEKELKQVAEGDLTKRVVLRKKDQITDMAESLNNMISSLHEKLLDIQTDVERIRQSASRQNAPKELIEELNKLHQNMANNFKI
ncbi:MAG: HAMP domain-containing protein [Proteobacteria bacterium]|nr:HAMP domain-containing protein [Pseudomonadota bacterium]